MEIMERHDITIFFDDGDQETTAINGTREEINAYYSQAVFVRGFEDEDGWKEYKHRVTSIRFND